MMMMMNFIRSRRRPRSVKEAELGHSKFVLLVSNETYKDSLVCSLNLLFGNVLVAAVVVVCLSSLMNTRGKRCIHFLVTS